MVLRRSFRTRLFLAIFLAGVGVSGVLLQITWRRSRAAQLQSLRTLLITSATAAAGQVDGDAHAAMRLSLDLAREPEYLALAEIGRRVKDSNPRFREVYTYSVVGEEPGWGRLVLARERDRARIGERYRMDRFPAMMRALSAPDADEDLASDEEGPSLSGYAPVKDRAGRTVGLFGIDVDGSVVDAMRAGLLWLFGFGALGAAAASAGLAWFLATRIHRPVRALTEAVERVAAGDYGTRVTCRTGDEFQRLSERFDAMVEGLEERQRLKQAMHVAMEVQRRLLPAGPPDVPGVDLAGSSDYCDETGGDYYDYPRVWPLPGGRVALTVGDVTGHGIAAALLMASARAVLRSHAEDEGPPSRLLGVVNRHLAHDAASGRFMTLFYGVLDPAAGTLDLANAGQAGCLVWRRREDRFEDLEAGGPPLGIVEDVSFPDRRVEGLRPGDLLVLATDGIWEARDAAGEFFGMEGLLAAVRAAANLPAKGVEAAVLEAVGRFRGAAPQTDDVTILVAKIGARGGAPEGSPGSGATATS